VKDFDENDRIAVADIFVELVGQTLERGRRPETMSSVIGHLMKTMRVWIEEESVLVRFKRGNVLLEDVLLCKICLCNCLFALWFVCDDCVGESRYCCIISQCYEKTYINFEIDSYPPPQTNVHLAPDKLERETNNINYIKYA
jgi:hypothetical protein